MDNDKTAEPSDEKWIRISTAADLRGIDRQSMYYRVRKHHLRTKTVDKVTFVHRDDVLALKIRAKNKLP